MSEFTAALGVVQTKRMNEIVDWKIIMLKLSRFKAH